MLANAAHIEEANANSIAYIDVEGLKAFNKDKTKIKKWHLSFYHSIVIYCNGVSSAGICPSWAELSSKLMPFWLSEEKGDC